jgi:hypothetical protein
MHRVLVLLIWLIFGLALAGPVAAGLSDDKSPLAAFERSHALVVGIDEYRGSGFRDLGNAVRDARAVEALLKAQDYDVTLLTDRQATKAAILGWFRQLVPKLGPNDRVVFFFGGHGYTVRNQTTNDETGYLIPWGTSGQRDWLDLLEIYAVADQIDVARHQLFVLNSCFGGLFGSLRSGFRDPNALDLLSDLAQQKARQYLAAGNADQEVIDGPQGGLSPFARLFIDGVRTGAADRDRDGYITFREMESYLQPEVYRVTRGLQTPIGGTMRRHRGGEYLFRVDTAVAATPQAPAAPQTGAPQGTRGAPVRVSAEFDLEAAREPVERLYDAWRRLDFAAYMDVWAPDAVQYIANQPPRRVPEIRARRTNDFQRFSSVDVPRFNIVMGPRNGNVVELTAFYEMTFRTRDNRCFVEIQKERYLVRFEPARNRWRIVENRDYLLPGKARRC